MTSKPSRLQVSGWRCQPNQTPAEKLASQTAQRFSLPPPLRRVAAFSQLHSQPESSPLPPLALLHYSNPCSCTSSSGTFQASPPAATKSTRTRHIHTLLPSYNSQVQSTTLLVRGTPKFGVLSAIFFENENRIFLSLGPSLSASPHAHPLAQGGRRGERRAGASRGCMGRSPQARRG